ncbi:MAG: hypothetical protein KJO01_11880 [Gammaproteobacteria bacterium]|nr:hypothetical protein [Gammaproteobacteria bacterium]MBT8109905.1 hypothetical protein [Gammaproteobacteria bacterium]NND47535.1 hypothetical protein [Woeseiaceae bacterium]NNL44607.1 hypothetical protein [Woeseiaceae bacterium]
MSRECNDNDFGIRSDLRQPLRVARGDPIHEDVESSTLSARTQAMSLLRQFFSFA